MASETSPISPDFVNHFDLSFNITKPIENDTIRPHPSFNKSDYRDEKVKNIQNKRRLEFLENLKKKRQAIIDKTRHVIEIDFFENNHHSVDHQKIIENSDEFFKDESVIADEKDQTSMDIDVNRQEKHRKSPNSKQQKHRKDFRKLIADKFMLSEWLVDIPEDFFQNWYMVCCPKGRRTLVVASNGRTKVYTRNGYFLFQFQSLIPGGRRSPVQCNIMNKNSMLDCIFVESEQTFYILDVIVWNGCTFYDCDTEFRFYWMHNHIGEEWQNSIATIKDSVAGDDVEMCENDNSKSLKRHVSNYRFTPLPYWPCSKENIMLQAKGPYPFKAAIDGILFYHKQAPYIAGITPLVCWLKVHMIPKLFNIFVSK